MTKSGLDFARGLRTGTSPAKYPRRQTAGICAALFLGTCFIFMRIFIVDDMPLVREVMRRVCCVECKCELLGEASTAAEAICLIKRARPDLILLDLGLPDSSGFVVAERIRRLWVYPPKIIALTCHCEPYSVVRSIEMGFDGFIDKNTEGLRSISKAIKTVMGGGTYFSCAFQSVRTRNETDPEAFNKLLTSRQRDILSLASTGIGDSRIAECLQIAVRTAETHRQNVMRKIGVSSYSSMIAYARKMGFWQ